MPPHSPLDNPVQDLWRAFHDPNAPGWQRASHIWRRRAAAFLPAVLTTGVLAWVFADWLSTGGIWWLEWVLLALVVMTFFWIALALGTATLGLFCYIQRKRSRRRGDLTPLRVALLVPIYNEDPAEVFGNACAMMSALRPTRSSHRFELFVLSDTQDAAIAMAEQQAFETLRAAQPMDGAVWYRRRVQNIGRKVGNVGQWLANWGAAYEAMIVLDADSLMSAEALIALSDEMAADPSVGLIQSAPMVIGSDTLFGRMQQFSAAVYGTLLSEGLAGWTGSEGNYWGHNAILRTRAFADCAGLPRMPSLRGTGGLILSHDFVEAGLLRRAGWAVRFMPFIAGSYEEPPATLIDYALRDRRWCHGNLQHLSLLGVRGFHAVSRFHLFHGAMSYLLSPVWFSLLVIWALHGNGPDSVIRYFSDENPLYPIWPEMSRVSSVLILLFMYGMLLAPKLMGALALGLTDVRIVRFGGTARFVLSLFTEILLSVLFAPIMMFQQVVAVLRTVIGIRPIWSPQARKGGDYSAWTVLKFHALETVSGSLLMLGMAAGVVSVWLLPIATSLIAAVPLSMLSGSRLSERPLLRHLMATPDMFTPPAILDLARLNRNLFRTVQQHPPIAAE
ncbi:MAG: glucans biosynthesis glucosyltransferase MdoH [Rhodobacteraceae bacterium CG17_big_fil_post_rev_8_21_14_2_50_63_15]|nr:glucans biosynthesis glucosyltransferase MdoH [Roseovarius sp.]PIV78471.1 MAG: glucans biosynthesis glucosyltransferase MdoH [Rhodobacteraceae bacterium CG17_big_fil_post_rev_8_21_14_2_50_63_15]